MFSVPEQFSNATKANFDAQLAMMTTLTGKTFEFVEKFVELNMSAAKSSLEDSATTVKQLFEAKGPQEFFSLTSSHAQPAAEKALAYGRHLATITSSTQAEFSHAAETQIAETNRKVLQLIEEVSKNAPAGSEDIVEFVKTVIGNANTSYRHLTSTTKQAVDAMETNLNSAVSQITQSTTKNAAKTVKK